MRSHRIPSLNWLRVFEAAARMQSFTRAADILHMSPSAVSQQIMALETHLGRPLFLRARHRVSLTDAGLAFFPVVQQSLATVETSAAALFGEEGREVITLQAVTLLAMSWLPSRVAAFEQANPRIRVNITTGNLLSEFNLPMPGPEPDLKIAFGSPSDFPESAIPFLGETLSAVASPGIAAKIRTPSDLRSMRLLEVATHRTGWHQLLAQAKGADIRHMQITFVDHTPLALMMAQQGYGLAIARSPASDVMVDALGLRRVRKLAQVKGLQSYHIIRPEGRTISRGAAMLYDWILSEGMAPSRRGQL